MVLLLEIVCRQHLLATYQQRPLHEVLQFANITRIGQAAQVVQSIVSQADGCETIGLATFFYKMAGQQRDVFTPFTQSWQVSSRKAGK